MDPQKKWGNFKFEPEIEDFTEIDLPPVEERLNHTPLKYFEQYIDTELLLLIKDQTNIRSVQMKGHSINLSLSEM